MNSEPAQTGRYLTRPLAPYEVAPAEGPGSELDALLMSGRIGLEKLASEVEGLLQGRVEASAEINRGIDRDLVYLENLILDRYQLGQRPTDDPVYIKLRLEQLHLEQERRKEQSASWRDSVLLSKERSDLFRRADDARRREDLLGGDMP